MHGTPLERDSQFVGEGLLLGIVLGSEREVLRMSDRVCCQDSGGQLDRKPKVLLIHLKPLFQVPDPPVELLVRELKERSCFSGLSLDFMADISHALALQLNGFCH